MSRALQQTLLRSSKVWHRRLEEISATSHRMSLKPRGHPIAQCSQRTRSETREFVAEDVQQICKKEITMARAAKRTAPVVIEPKHDGSDNMSIGYCRRSTVAIRD